MGTKNPSRILYSSKVPKGGGFIDNFPIPCGQCGQVALVVEEHLAGNALKATDIAWYSRGIKYLRTDK